MPIVGPVRMDNLSLSTCERITTLLQRWEALWRDRAALFASNLKGDKYLKEWERLQAETDAIDKEFRELFNKGQFDLLNVLAKRAVRPLVARAKERKGKEEETS